MRRALDRYVRRLYDWNFYATAHVMAESAERASKELATSILSMIAERQLDIIESTRIRARDALLRASNSGGYVQQIASKLLGDTKRPLSLPDVFDVAASTESNDLSFLEWKKLFLTSPGASVPEHVLHKLESVDSVVGWTCSNVLKRLRLTPDAEQRICRVASNDGSSVVRWRCVHALGASTAESTIKTLDERANSDASPWVRYGAMRSLIEIASLTTGEKQESALRVLVSLAEAIALPKTREFARNLVLHQYPDDWFQRVRPILTKLIDREQSVESRDEIERVAQRIYEKRPVSPE